MDIHGANRRRADRVLTPDDFALIAKILAASNQKKERDEQ